MSDLVSAFQAATESALSEVNTASPGILISYNHDTNRAVVKASLPKALADGRDLPAPNIHEVVVAWPSGGGMVTTWPLRPGDGMLLVFGQRSLEGWLSGNDAAPDDPRRFDISDCIAVPGLRATGISADPDAVQCVFGGTTVRLEPGGVSRITGTKTFISNPVEITGNVTITGAVAVTGTVTTPADVLAGTVSLKTHVHTASGGSGIGGPPVGA